jgi:hypothetical protein
LRKAREQLIFRVALQFRGNSRQNRNLHQVHQVQVAEKPQTYQPWRSRMKRQRSLHPVALEQGFAPGHFIENLYAKILSFQQQANVRFLKGRIVEERLEHIRGRMMQQNGKFLPRSDERAFHG